MTQVVISNTENANADGNTIGLVADGTGAITVPSGRVLTVVVILATQDTSKEVDNIEYAGAEAMAVSPITDFVPTHGLFRLEVWQLLAPSAGSGDVVVTIEGGNSQKTGVFAFAANLDTTTAHSGKVTDEDTDTSGTVSPNQGANDLGFAFAAHNDKNVYTTTAGDELLDLEVAGQFQMWAASIDGSGATALTWTQSAEKENATMGFVLLEAPDADVLQAQVWM